MKMKIIINLLILSFLSNYIYGQFNVFEKNFVEISLPFEVGENTFDIYASEDPYIISEKEFKTYLVSKNDSFLLTKNSLSLNKNTYPDYFAVGKFNIYNNYIGLLYYRSYIRNDKIYSELILTVLEKKGVIISAIPISKIDAEENISLYSIIYDGDNINIDIFEKDDDGDKINKERFYQITNDGNIMVK